MVPFFSKFKEVAENETRTISLLQPMMGLPPDDYALIEFYCDDPGCDCRRVILQVWGKDKPGVSLATFNFGWESPEFYTQWVHGDAELAREMHGLAVEPFGPQSRLTEPLRALVEMVLSEDRAYVDRLKRHYNLFKQSLNWNGGRPQRQ